MFELLMYALLVGVLLFIFSSRVRAWVLARIIESLQRRMFRQMEEQAKAQYKRAGARSERTHQSERTYQEEPQAHSGKLDMDDIATKKFDKPQSEDYVDFEELPK